MVNDLLQGMFFSYVPEWVLEVLAQTKTIAAIVGARQGGVALV
ncbi:hypothetical protein QUF58_10655 [Anaerolineales bacterium HSG24]|nr:hypothetical protein [Anaerolineales bacterium HSG24]